MINKIFILSIVFFIFFCSNAYAYLDPGTGSMILQLLLGGIAGLAIIAKLFWHKLVNIFKPGSTKNNK
jgi:hypothetical protein